MDVTQTNLAFAAEAALCQPELFGGMPAAEARPLAQALLAEHAAAFRQGGFACRTFAAAVLPGHGLRVGEEVFASTALARLTAANEVYGFVLSAGHFATPETLLEQFLLDQLANAYVSQLCEAMLDCLRQHRQTEQQLALLAPGSLASFPLAAAKTLYRLLRPLPADLGVQQLESAMLMPQKSMLGLVVPVQQAFESCILCPRSSCTSRRSNYQPEAAAQLLRGLD